MVITELTLVTPVETREVPLLPGGFSSGINAPHYLYNK